MRERERERERIKKKTTGICEKVQEAKNEREKKRK